MKILFISFRNRSLYKFYEISAILTVLLILFIYMSVPSQLRTTLCIYSGSVDTIYMEQEMRPGTGAFSSSFIDYYYIVLSNKEKKKFRSLASKEIKKYGIENIKGSYANIEYRKNKNDTIYFINSLIINDKVVFDHGSVGYFPFLIFVGIFCITLPLSVWGFYVKYIVSDKSRKEILEN